MPLCRCCHCLEEVLDDKPVSKSTFHHHAKKSSLDDTAHFFRICFCHLHPTGHCFQSQSAYFQHHAIVRSSLFTTDEEILLNVSSSSVSKSADHSSSTTDVNSDHDDDDIMHVAWDDVDSSESSDIDESGMSLFYLIQFRINLLIFIDESGENLDLFLDLLQ